MFFEPWEMIFERPKMSDGGLENVFETPKIAFGH